MSDREYQQQPYGYGQPPMPRKSVAKQRKDTSHTFHLIMTVCTFGMWGLFVWMPLTAWHKIGPKQKVVTRYR